jgi:enoyl-CoA hydratase/carnithine racemase
VVGPRRALELILTGAPISAATALDWGLVNHVVPSARLWAATMALAATIAANAPTAVRVSKQTVLASLSNSDEVALQANEAAFEAVRHSSDAREGVNAFVQGRAPVWTGVHPS